LLVKLRDRFAKTEKTTHNLEVGEIVRADPQLSR
jgi:hypothetical protein